MLTTSLLVFIASIVAIWAVGKFVTWYRMFSLIEKFEGPKGYPILGNIIPIMAPPEEFLEVLRSFCTPTRGMTRIWISHFYPYVLLHKSKPVEALLSSSKTITKARDYDYLLPWLGTGLLISTGQKWFHRRKMITPAFHFKILDDFNDIFNEKANILVERLSKMTNGKEFDLFNFVTLCTLDIILETAMGLDLNVQNENDTPYIHAVKEIVGIVQDRQKKPWLYSDFFFSFTSASKRHDECIRILHQLSLSTIKSRRKQLRLERESKKDNTTSQIEGTKKKLPFLDLLLEYSEQNSSLTDTDIREEVDTFMFEGHDTTATAINMTFYLLGTNPEAQKKVHDELDAVLGNSDEPLGNDQLRDLKYLECCIKEALRLFPSVPIFTRESDKEVEIDGKVIPRGTSIGVFTYALHRDPEQFPDPEKFDPDRFLPENSIGRPAYAYVPFSAGPRNCIGQKFAMQEEKIVLAKVLQRFEVKSLDTREQLQMMGEIIMRPKNGIRVTLKERHRK